MGFDLSFLKDKSAELLQAGTKELSKNSPKILTAMGIVGCFGAIVAAVKAKPKADLLIHEAKAVKAAEANENGEALNIEDIKLTPLETAKAVAPAYWPTAATFVLSAGAIFASDYISDKRQVALSAAYAIADTSLKEFQKKSEETIGQKKTAEIEQKITQDHVTKNPPSPEQINFLDLNQGYSLFMAPYTEEIFCARIDSVHDVFINANMRLSNDPLDDVLLNDLLYDLNTRAVSVALNGRGVSENKTVGTLFYWNADTGKIKYHFSATNVPGTEYVCNKIIIDTSPRCCIDPRQVDAAY